MTHADLSPFEQLCADLEQRAYVELHNDISADLWHVRVLLAPGGPEPKRIGRATKRTLAEAVDAVRECPGLRVLLRRTDPPVEHWRHEKARDLWVPGVDAWHAVLPGDRHRVFLRGQSAEISHLTPQEARVLGHALEEAANRAEDVTGG